MCVYVNERERIECLLTHAAFLLGIIPHPDHPQAISPHPCDFTIFRDCSGSVLFGTVRFKFFYPISTLPEHLHSISLSYAETTLNSRKLVSFPLIAHYLSAGPPLPPTPPFTGRPGHTHTYPSFLVSAPSKPVVLLVALTCCVCFALKALKLPVFSFALTLLTFSVSYLWIISYIYIHT